MSHTLFLSLMALSAIDPITTDTKSPSTVQPIDVERVRRRAHLRCHRGSQGGAPGYVFCD